MFTRSTVDEFKLKAGDLGQNVSINTAHSFGLKSLKNSWPQATMKKDKVEKILFAQYGGAKEVSKHYPLIAKMVGLAKDAGYCLPPADAGPSSADLHARLDGVNFEHIVDHHDLFDNIKKEEQSFILEKARFAFRESIIDTFSFDFSDMIYLPLFYGKLIEQFDYVFVDEAQDTNFLRCLFYSKMMKPYGSMVVVGDRSQAIMGFTGAGTEAMEDMEKMLMGKKKEIVHLSLSICFRCAGAIIRKAQEIEPDIMPMEGVEEGRVAEIEYKKFMELAINLKPTSAILCRLNAPNVMVAFALMRQNIPCRIEGRDLGFGLIKLIEKLERNVDTYSGSIAELLTPLDKWYDEELAKALEEKKLFKLSLIEDKYHCLLYVFESVQTIDEAKRKIKLLFSDDDGDKQKRQVLTLSSVHKSKGREWPTVYLLASDALMPSPRAKSDWQIKQEHNLIYVAITRAQKMLVEITKVPLK